MAYRMTLVLLGILAGSALAPMLVAKLGGGRRRLRSHVDRGGFDRGRRDAALLLLDAQCAIARATSDTCHLREQIRLVIRNRQFLCLLSVYLVQLLALGTMTAAHTVFCGACAWAGRRIDRQNVPRLDGCLRVLSMSVLVCIGAALRQAARVRRVRACCTRSPVYGSWPFRSGGNPVVRSTLRSPSWGLPSARSSCCRLPC